MLIGKADLPRSLGGDANARLSTPGHIAAEARGVSIDAHPSSREQAIAWLSMSGHVAVEARDAPSQTHPSP